MPLHSRTPQPDARYTSDFILIKIIIMLILLHVIMLLSFASEESWQNNSRLGWTGEQLIETQVFALHDASLCSILLWEVTDWCKMLAWSDAVLKCDVCEGASTQCQGMKYWMLHDTDCFMCSTAYFPNCFPSYNIRDYVYIMVLSMSALYNWIYFSQ